MRVYVGVCVRKHTHTHTHMHMHTCTRARTHTHAHAHTRALTRSHTLTHWLVCLQASGLRVPVPPQRVADQVRLASLEERVSEFAKGVGTVLVDADNVRGKVCGNPCAWQPMCGQCAWQP